MKVKYLGTLLAASVLSLGVLTSCADTAGDTDVTTDGTTEIEPGAEVNPCAGVEEPDVEADPCAGS